MADLKFYDVIERPVITENSMAVLEEKKYTFIVHPEATKAQIKDAVEKMFEGAKVASVNTINVYDLLKYNTLVVTKEAVEKIQEVYA